MTLLRRVLYYQAFVWGACGIAIAVAPHWVLQSVFDQVSYPDEAFVRVCGAMSVGLALLMVLVAQKVDVVWWWAWAFAMTDAAIVTITGTHALFGLPVGSGAAVWWLFAGVNLVLGASILVGIGRAAQAKPFT
jgi:hypothetical protein